MTLTTLLGINLPVLQAPMAGVQGSALAVAVSNAGGLGALPCAMLGPDALRQELAAIRAQTDRPFNVNFFCHTPPVPDDAREAAWRAALAPAYAEFGIDPAAIPAGPGRRPFDAETAELLAAFAPPVVSFHFGLPSPELLARVRGWGAKVLSSATTVEEARWLEAHGVDAVIAQGLEAGGHRGHFLSDDLTRQMGTFALLPQIVAAVRVPVIAAGGIADAAGGGRSDGARRGGGTGRHGLSAVPGSDHQRRPPCGAAERSGAPHGAHQPVRPGGRHVASSTGSCATFGPMNEAAPGFPLATSAVAPLRTRAEALGLGDFSPLWSGQHPDGCREVPAARLTRDLVSLLP